MGAVAPGGVRVLDDIIIREARVSPQDIERITTLERAELERRERRYRGNRAFPNIANKTVILVDDGLATGSSMRAAVHAVRKLSPSDIVVAVPVAAAETCEAFRDIVDEVVCAETPEPFGAVGFWYEDFSQTSDEEVHDLLERAQHAPT